MLDYVDAIHKALNIKSTWQFVVLVALAFGVVAAIAGGALAWVVDARYKNSPEYKAGNPDPKSQAVATQQAQTPTASQQLSPSQSLLTQTNQAAPKGKAKRDSEEEPKQKSQATIGSVTQGAGSAFSVNQMGGTIIGTVNLETPNANVYLAATEVVKSVPGDYQVKYTLATDREIENNIGFTFAFDGTINRYEVIISTSTMIQLEEHTATGVTSRFPNNVVEFTIQYPTTFPVDASIFLTVYSKNPVNLLGWKRN